MSGAESEIRNEEWRLVRSVETTCNEAIIFLVAKKETTVGHVVEETEIAW
jgi:hypothetical protein